MNKNVNPSDRATLVGLIEPDAHAPATINSGWIDMADIGTLQAIIFAGTLAAGATLDAKLEQATDAAGAGVKDIVGKAITQLTQAGGDSNKQAILNLWAHELDANGDFTHVRVTMVVATASADAGAAILGHDARDQPLADLASVVQVIGAV